MDSKRAALFGSAATQTSNHKNNNINNNKNQAGGKSNRSRPPPPPATATATTAAEVTTKNSSTMNSTSTANKPAAGVSKWKVDLAGRDASEKVAKMNEAENLRKKGKDAMRGGLFSASDPHSASVYYRQAATLYKACGEPKLEMLLRLSIAELPIGEKACAMEYELAGELALRVEDFGVEKSSYYYQNAALLYHDAGDYLRAANATRKAGEVYIDIESKEAMTGYESKCLEFLERYISLLVPMALNPRRDNASILKSDGIEDVLVAESKLVTKAYTAKNILEVVKKFIDMGEYSSALYAVGAAISLMEHEGNTTSQTLHLSYLYETVLLLALGDPISANSCMMRHFQQTSYLRSKECELEEDLVRAIDSCSADGLQLCKENRTMLHIDGSVAMLINKLQVYGAVKKESVVNEDEEDIDDLFNAADDAYQELNDVMADLDDFDLT